MTADKVFTILQTHVPATAVDYCFALWKDSPFELKLTKSRQTKVGDFTSKHTRAHPRITLNHDLNPYLFLTTYVHEVAHLRVYVKFGGRVDPHGEKWKTMFTDLLVPLLWESVFPDEILHELRRHMINPKASSFADTELTAAFRKFDKNAQALAVLSDIPEGSIFKLQGKFFIKGKLRRTRVLCKELKSKRDYLVPVDALVSNVQLSLL
ncbi:SprT-like domain-containing protein [Chryseolinea lacunae]|uniref:SprT-like domain-containing protein n=1 Tax=Chryseolinea lacunae TaxID=2801331 RepID=A0ABS1KPU7_9BACT|nr:SprT-like domain-containing protein [Chryseolinea lacunae]MBL0741480.1 SprT-like domain-containing protein [Chryseolinea lacunae]